HAPASLDRGGCSGPGVRRAAGASADLHPGRMPRPRQHQREGSSRWHRRAQKKGPQAIGKSRGGWNTKVHMVAANERTALTFSLSGGQAHDAPEGRALLEAWDKQGIGPLTGLPLLMDRAYEGDETR